VDDSSPALWGTTSIRPLSPHIPCYPYRTVFKIPPCPFFHGGNRWVLTARSTFFLDEMQLQRCQLWGQPPDGRKSPYYVFWSLYRVPGSTPFFPWGSDTKMRYTIDKTKNHTLAIHSDNSWRQAPPSNSALFRGLQQFLGVHLSFPFLARLKISQPSRSDANASLFFFKTKASPSSEINSARARIRLSFPAQPRAVKHVSSCISLQAAT